MESRYVVPTPHTKFNKEWGIPTICAYGNSYTI